MASDCLRRASWRGWPLVAAVFSLALMAPTQAAADNPPPPEDIPAVGAYVELVPAAGGSRQAGRRQGDRGLPLPAEATRRLDAAAGQDNSILKRVATAPDLGAPTRRLPLHDPPPTTGASAKSIPTSLESVGQTLVDGGDLRLLLLLVAMAAVILGGLVAAFRRARL
jgi:hypothetical protein